MDAERQKMLDTLVLYKELEEKREQLRKTEDELKRVLHFMCFWPKGYQTKNPETGKPENPKIKFETQPGTIRLGSKFWFTMSREDLGESRTFWFKVRRPKTERVQDDRYTNRVMKTVFLEKPTIGTGLHSWVVELIRTDDPDLEDLSDIPQEAIADVCGNFIRNVNPPEYWRH
jgi:hypothetical protein